MNSLKTFMNKVSDRVRDVTLEPGFIDSQPTSLTSSQPLPEQDKQEGAVEGFVCPTCFTNFTAAELLHSHYEREHLDPAANYLCPVCKMRLGSQEQLETHYSQEHTKPENDDVSVESLQEELVELRTTLREERWHSEDLRQELELLQQSVQANSNDSGHGEDMVPQSQHAALQASRAELSTEAVALRRQLSQALEESSSVRRQLTEATARAEAALSSKQTVEARASEYAVERAELRSKLDLMQEEKSSLQSQLSDYQRLQEGGDPAETVRLTGELDRLLATLQERDKQSVTERADNRLHKIEQMVLRGQLQQRTRQMEVLQQREANLHADLKAQSEALAEQRQESRSLKEEVDQLKRKLQHSTNEHRQSSEQLTTLMTELAAATMALTELRQQSARDKEQLSALREQLQESQSSCKELTERVQQQQRDVQSRQEQLVAGDRERQQLLQQSREKDLEVSRLTEALGDVSREENEVMARKTQQLQELQQQLLLVEQARCDLQGRLAGAEGDLSASSGRLTTAERALEQQREKMMALQDRSSLQAGQIRELTSEVERLKGVEAELEQSRSSALTLAATAEQQRQQLGEVEARATELEHNLQTSRDGVTAMEADKKILLAKSAALKNDVDEKDRVIQELQKRLTQETESGTEATLKLQGLMVQKDKSDDSLRQLSASLAQAEVSLSHTRTRLEDVTRELEAKSRECSAVTEQLDTQKREREETEQTLSKRLELAEHNCSDLSEQVEQSCAELTALRAMQTELSEKLANEKLESKKLHEEKRSADKHIEARSSEVTDLQQQLRVIKAERDDVKEKSATLTAEVEQLTVQVSAAEGAAADLSEQYAVEMSTLQDRITAAETAAELQRGALTAQLQGLQNEVRDAQSHAAEERSRAEEAEVLVATLQATLAEVQGDKLELEVRLEGQEKEQQGLIERCLSAESEREILSLSITQLRRKLDDSTGALHELGRQNQTLQLETNKLSGRKWTEDEEVKHCSSCTKAFSMTVRRHHCRNCGQIFCGDCSARQAPLEQNKKPVRVCDNCHNELITRLGQH